MGLGNLGIRFLLLMSAVLIVAPLTLGCIVSWLREWRHGPQGRVFFTLLTVFSILLVLGMIVAGIYGTF